MRAAKMTRVAAGPSGTLHPGDFAPEDLAESFVKAKAAEWVEVDEKPSQYGNAGWQGQAVVAFASILDMIGQPVPRDIEPMKVAAAVHDHIVALKTELGSAETRQAPAPEIIAPSKPDTPEGSGDGAETPEGGGTDTETRGAASEFPKHIGGGHYKLSNGEQVKGKDEALAAEAKLHGE